MLSGGERRRLPGRRVVIAVAVAGVLVLIAARAVVVARRHVSNPCRPAARPVAVAGTDRVESVLGDAGATGAATLTAPHGTLVAVWCASVDIRQSPSGALPIVARGVLYASGQHDTRALSVDLSTGRTRWRSPVIGTPVALSGTHLIVEGYDAVSDVDPATGEPRWTTRAVPRSGSGLEGLTVVGSRLFVLGDDIGDDQSWLSVLDLESGRLQTSRALGAGLEPFLPPVVADGRVTVALDT
jgi:outer membrane protein assembly factor BamB